MIRRTTWRVVLALGCAGAMLAPAAPASAQTGEGKLTVNVFREFAANGTLNPQIQTALAGATIRIRSDRSGQTQDYQVGANGTITINFDTWAGSRGKYRIELIDWPDKYDPVTGAGFLRPAFAGSGLSSHLNFVDMDDDKDVTLDLAVWNPDDYCQDNPTMATACQQAATNPGSKTLVTFPYNSRGDTQGSTTNPKPIAHVPDTGALYGLAYRKKEKWLFSGAYAKRHTEYGNGGPGAIYLTDRATNTTSLFATVPNAGTTSHNQAGRVDASFSNRPGKESLGDIEISSDGKELYVVNMNDGKLYTYNATQASVTGPKRPPIKIPDSACAPPGDWRPMGLGVRDGVLYVGGVCSAESTQDVTKLRAVVWKYDPATGTFGAAPIVDEPLDFPRDPALDPAPGNWKPWTKDDLTQFPMGGASVAYPQPMLSDIEVERDGSLVLGFRDRYGDQSGLQIPNANPASGNRLESANTGGDINKVCRKSDGTYHWEGSADCPRNGNEFYTGDTWYTGASHRETAQGALALPLQQDRIASTVMDPVRTINSGGIGFFDRTTGGRGADPSQQGFGVVYANDGGFAKAHGLGDLELLCDEPPVQIGNRVWFDDGGGTQNSLNDENLGIPGVTVTLRDAAGRVIATKKTNAKGEYYFDHRDGVQPETDYTVEFDKTTANTSNLPNVNSVSDLMWTRPGRPNSATNSDAVPTGGNDSAPTAVANVRTGPPGSVNHDLDAGMWAGT
ncbi:SdrD B-like domain-containing protein [Streptomyces sp. NPDC005322]|uniref:SdrD B-like domain-containing protein n=1 Tax=Streptomyces sp. NPDC005322 TaxID=3157032 RepID=UPI0033A19BEC